MYLSLRTKKKKNVFKRFSQGKIRNFGPSNRTIFLKFHTRETSHFQEKA